MMINPFEFTNTLDSRKVVKYKCRACKREFIENNRIPLQCKHCKSNKFHEMKSR